MSEIEALSAEDILRRIYEHLQPLVEISERGHLSVARDPLETLEQLGQAPGSFRVILQWVGEKPEGNNGSGIVTHDIQVIISHNRGLSAVRGDNLFLGRAAGDVSLVALVARIRESLRKMRFPNRITSVLLDYRGTDPVAIDDTMIDAYATAWRLTAALPPAEV